MKSIGITITSSGSAIVHVDHQDAEELLVTSIERLPFDLTTVAIRVLEVDREIVEARFTIDGEGLGGALWTVLGPPDNEERWTLYTGRGVERQGLVDRLLVAIHEGRFHFASRLPEQEAMTKALQGHRRQVGVDGLVGSELVVALLLVLIPPPPAFEPAAVFVDAR